MKSRATWRAHRGDPQAWLGWLLHDAGAPLRLASHRLSNMILLMVIPAVLRGQWLAAAIAIVLASAPAALVDLLVYVRGFRLLPPGPIQFVPKALPVDDLLTVPPPELPFPCRIEIDKGGTLLGTDLGVVTFLEGWLHYEGRRTNFALRPSDVSDRSGTRVYLVEGQRIVFAPHAWVSVGDLLEFDLKERFEANLKSWMRTEASDDGSLLPPSSFHPSGIVRAWSDLVAGTLLAVLIFAFLLWFSGAWWSAFLMLPFVHGIGKSLRDVIRVCRRPRLSLPAPAVE